MACLLCVLDTHKIVSAKQSQDTLLVINIFLGEILGKQETKVMFTGSNNYCYLWQPCIVEYLKL